MDATAQTPAAEIDAFPTCGFRARRWLRFERDLQAWLDTPEGRFVAWEAERATASE